ncbi:ROK family protein [Paenibacillus donghaensis]|uniref:Transcriptional regulator n=1 Tax=Paenibacillus donghaensis TaxID=414771 RepID=A0A2Z2KUD6_9BACL|nr:ROK family protein [Paenibacillus donghaensis]ASA23338.1 transcriptional regulator [Paenibacillus donghaensis]
MNYAVGIDIGGTKTALGLISSDGQVLTKTSLTTDLSLQPSDMVDKIAEAAFRLLSDEGLQQADLKGMGIGAPGPLNTKLGQIAEPPNLRNWWNFPIIHSFKRHFQVPIVLENDATAAALAEKWTGAAKAADHFIYITISTGIGAGIYSHGRLITGATGNAGDIGHMVIDPSRGLCNCGQRGCFEFIASGTAIAREASSLLGRRVTSKEVFELALSGQDPVMERLVNRVFGYIGTGCVTLINTFDPELLVIGGGVSQVGAPLFEAIRDYIKLHALNPSGRNTPVVPAALQQNAGLIGAAALIHTHY